MLGLLVAHCTYKVLFGVPLRQYCYGPSADVKLMLTDLMHVMPW
jgi:hypothetical protein